jgi:hypothetical protein
LVDSSGLHPDLDPRFSKRNRSSTSPSSSSERQYLPSLRSPQLSEECKFGEQGEREMKWEEGRLVGREREEKLEGSDKDGHPEYTLFEKAEQGSTHRPNEVVLDVDGDDRAGKLPTVGVGRSSSPVGSKTRHEASRSHERS